MPALIVAAANRTLLTTVMQDNGLVQGRDLPASGFNKFRHVKSAAPKSADASRLTGPMEAVSVLGQRNVSAAGAQILIGVQRGADGSSYSAEFHQAPSKPVM